MRADLIHEIERERDRQDELWGGPSHDDTHSREDWLAYLDDQIFKASGVLLPDPNDLPQQVWRARLVKIAALAVAAIESNDRQGKDE